MLIILTEKLDYTEIYICICIYIKENTKEFSLKNIKGRFGALDH